MPFFLKKYHNPGPRIRDLRRGSPNLWHGIQNPGQMTLVLETGVGKLTRREGLILNTKQWCQDLRIKKSQNLGIKVVKNRSSRPKVSLRIQPECGKKWTRVTPNTDTFYAVRVKDRLQMLLLTLNEFK